MKINCLKEKCESLLNHKNREVSKPSPNSLFIISILLSKPAIKIVFFPFDHIFLNYKHK